MDQKEKDRAEMEAKLNLLNTTLEELTVKWEVRKENRPDINLKNLQEKKDLANSKFQELGRASDEEHYRELRYDLGHMMDDIDNDLKSAWAYLMH